MRSLASDGCGVIATNAPPPSRTARVSRTVSVPSGSVPSSTTSANPPHRNSSSAPLSASFLLLGWTRNGPSSQNAPTTVPAVSIQTARSLFATVERQAARSMEQAPPWGVQTVSCPRGSPPPGNIRSSGATPVTTGSAARQFAGVASGKRCSISSRRAAMETAGIGEDGDDHYPTEPTGTTALPLLFPSAEQLEQTLYRIYPEHKKRPLGALLGTGD